MLEVRIDDEGPGLQNTGNLFVPFFTTKAGGSGIGLVLEPADRRRPRRLADAREPRDERGVRATLRLPL